MHAQPTVAADPQGIRLIVMVVFFVCYVLIDNRRPLLDLSGKPGPHEPDAIDRIYGAKDEACRRRAFVEALLTILCISGFTPFLYYLRFGNIGPLAWGLAVFFDVILLLMAVAAYFEGDTEYHAPVKHRLDWLDRIGGFWLVGCAFGPFFGWAVVNGWPLTQDSWHWRYGLRAFLAAGLPILLGLPLLRYAHGKYSLRLVLLLLLVTLLPVSTGIGSIQDLWEGPVARDGKVERVRRGGRWSDVKHPEWYLKYTDRIFERRP
jgi:MFS family permease